MSRKTRDRTLRIRYKNGGQIHSTLVIGNTDKARKKLLSGGNRILRIGKVSDAELNKVGEFFNTKKLLEDIRRNPSGLPSSLLYNDY